MDTARRTLLILGFIVIANPALGYEVKTTEDGDIVRWRRPVVQLKLDSSLKKLGAQEEVEAALEEMVEVWIKQAKVPVEFKFKFGDCRGFGYNQHAGNENCIAASNNSDLWESQIDVPPGATTILSFDSDDGTILDADIIFNTADWNWSLDGGGRDELDVRTAFVHEFGHLIGLDHSEYDDAVMYPTTYLGASFDDQLHRDDIAAVDSAYAGYDEEIMHLFAPENCTSSVIGSAAGIDISAIPPFILFAIILALLRHPYRTRREPVRPRVGRNRNEMKRRERRIQ